MTDTSQQSRAAAQDGTGASRGGGHAGGKPMRILHVLFSSRIAGSERYCIDLANAQAALGHEVHVAGIAGSPMAGELSPRVRFHGLSLPLFRGMRLRWLAGKIGADLAHAHLSPACKAVARGPKGLAKVATLHVGYKPRQHARLDGVICVNRAQLKRLDDYGGRAVLIANWMPELEAGAPLDLRARLNLPRGTRLVGAVGRLHPSKGCDVLVSAFLKASPPDAALVLAGEGPQRAELEKLSGGDPRIHLIGHCANVPGFLANLDLFVSPSREETAGLAILEAMQAGLPIVSTATDGPSEYLAGHPVTLVEPGSVDHLAAAIGVAFQPDNIAGLARVCYDMRPFSRSAGVANVLQFYSEIAARP